MCLPWSLAMAWLAALMLAYLALSTSAEDGNKDSDSKCTSFADIGFIVDSSTSLVQSYDKEKDFIKKLAKKLNVSERGNHASVVLFSEFANLTIPFFKDNDLNAFGKTVDALPFLDSTTRIDRALRVAYDQMFTEKNGMRKDSRKVLILMTDGEQTKDEDAVPPGEAIKPIYRLGTSVIVIGIGSRANKAEDELRSMVQATGALFFAANFDELRLNSFLNTIVSSARIGCYKKVPKCGSFTDIGFIMDSSGSLRSEYGKEKEFVKLLAESFGLSKGGPRGGLITFSDVANIELRFSEFTSLENFKNKVENLPLVGTITRIDLALEAARSELFADNSGKSKPDQKLLILLTDGSQIPEPGYTEPYIIADAIRKSGISLVIIGIGDGISMYELNRIAGQESKIYLAKSFNDLLSEEFVQRIRGNFCEENDAPIKPEKCTKADVGLLFDATKGEEDDFELRKALMRQIIDRLGFSPFGSHPGLISYGENPTFNVKFSERKTSNMLSSIISRFSTLNGKARLDRALKMAVAEMYKYYNGMRLGSDKLLIVVTSNDGSQDTRTQSFAEAVKPIHGSNIRVIVVGIGLKSRPNPLQELVQRSSDLVLPGSLNGNSMNSLVDLILEKACRENAELKKCSSAADIAFLLDSSTNLKENYNSEKFVVKEIAESYNIAPGKTHVSLIAYSNVAEVIFGFKENYDLSQFQYAVDQLQPLDSVNRIDLALLLVDSKVFTAMEGMRQSVPKVLFILTDGSQTKDYPHKDPAQIAAKLRSRGIKIIAIGVGDLVNQDELVQLAGNSNNVYLAKTTSELRASPFIKQILEKSCRFASARAG